MKIDALTLFKNLYGNNQNSTQPLCFSSSGRVNIIGEHIDYNGGYVLPVAIDMACRIYCIKNDLNRMRVAYTTTEFRGEIDYKSLDSYRDAEYINYIAGVLKVLSDEHYTLQGLDVVYDIGVPFGSGLSSSAAIEVATGYMMSYFAGVDIYRTKLALQAQKAENEYVGVNCGIMDQFASANGKKDCAILLDCATLNFEHIPFKLENHSLYIINTNRPHNLKESKYNERRQECEDALAFINENIDVKYKHLCEITPDEFDNLAKEMPQNLYERATHCVYEQQRVIDATIAMKSGDVESLGKLLTQSHESLRDLYKVSCFELDTIVDILSKDSRVSGARMTGGGFGGCCVAIIKNGSQDLLDNLLVEYKNKTGLDADVYVARIDDGARMM